MLEYIPRDSINPKEIEISQEILDNAQILWNYQRIDENPKKADFIIVSGHELRLVDKAVQLFNDGYAPYLVVSGGFLYGEIRGFESEDNDKTEAEVFKQEAIKQGISENKIILQDKPKNMGQVLKYTKEILANMKITVKKGIFIFEPDAQRRAKASLEKQWPEISSIVTSINITMEEYANNELPMPELIKRITANMRKIIEYPARGFQTEQDIPQEIKEAYNNLLKAGVLDS